MAYVLRDRVRETTTTSGTGAIYPAGVVTGGYQTFASVLSNGDTTQCLVRNDAGQWQTFLGTWSSGTQSMARTTVYDGSDGEGVAVGFSGEAQEIWINYPAEKYHSPKVQDINIGGPDYSANSGPRLVTIYKDQSLSASSYSVFRLGGIARGTMSSAGQGIYFTGFDEDRLAFSDTNDAITTIFNSITLRAGWSGGRTLQQDQLYVGNPALPGTSAEGEAGVSAYHVAGASFGYSYTNAGGQPGAERGNLFGRNDAVRVREGSGPHWNSAFGNETDVGVEAEQMVLWKGGMKIVQWSTDRVRGLIQDFAYGINNQANTSTPGWRHGFALGGFEGYWPFRTDSTIMGKINANGGAGNATEAGQGINLRGITFGESAFASDGFRVGATGNLGALTASGVALQTRSAVNAATAVVNTITVIDGGLFISPVTLTLTAPTTSGTTATATVATYSMQAAGGITTGGIDYAVGDTIAVSGGTSSVAATGVVTHITDTGGVIGYRMTNAGTNSYSALPSNPVSTTTSGAGTGFTFTPLTSVLTVTVSGAGTNYSEHLPPTVASAGSTTYRPATFAVAMTATAAPILLGSNYANYASVTGAASLSPTTVTAAGTDSNIILRVLGKGTSPTESLRLILGTSNGSAALFDGTTPFTIRNNPTYSTTMSQSALMQTTAAGTTNGTGQLQHFTFNIVDTVTAASANDVAGAVVYHTINAGSRAPRVGFQTSMTLNGATNDPAANRYFWRGFSAEAAANATAGGTLGVEAGNWFGAIAKARLRSGALYYNSVVAFELDVEAATGSSVLYKNGMQIVQMATDAVAGSNGVDTGLMFAAQDNGTTPGWDVGISFGHPFGWWPMNATGTLIGTETGFAGSPAYAAAYGVDFNAVTFSSGAFRSTGFLVDGSGTMTTTGQLLATRVVTAAGAVTVGATDDVVVVNKTVGAATTVNLPAGVTKRRYTIKDGKGDAAANNITITPAAGNIDGAGTLVLNTNYGRATVIYNGTEWNQV
jgi:hypothetical protein